MSASSTIEWTKKIRRLESELERLYDGRETGLQESEALAGLAQSQGLKLSSEQRSRIHKERENRIEEIESELKGLGLPAQSASEQAFTLTIQMGDDPLLKGICSKCAHLKAYDESVDGHWEPRNIEWNCPFLLNNDVDLPLSRIAHCTLFKQKQEAN
jgi:hypothetical protein